MTGNRWAVVAVTAGALTLTACGSSGGSTGASSGSTTTTTEASTSTSTGEQATLRVADTSLGKVVAGADGKVLYLYKPDGTAEVSTVSEGLLGAWPPVVVTTTPTVGTGLDASLVSTGTQPDGAKWVRYNGHLLYGFTGDAAPGDTNGNGLGGVWFAVTTAGDPVGS